MQTYPEGARIILSNNLRNAILIERNEKVAKYKIIIKLPSGNEDYTEFSMVFEEGKWKFQGI
ncbi:MAG: hypothetical protein GY804_08045 [Alphaproteobacteria bacterium]|nr:hypothetical protein [Alphaproteobacteria bacterium]